MHISLSGNSCNKELRVGDHHCWDLQGMISLTVDTRQL